MPAILRRWVGVAADILRLKLENLKIVFFLWRSETTKGNCSEDWQNLLTTVLRRTDGSLNFGTTPISRYYINVRI